MNSFRSVSLIWSSFSDVQIKLTLVRIHHVIDNIVDLLIQKRKAEWPINDLIRIRKKITDQILKFNCDSRQMRRLLISDSTIIVVIIKFEP